MTDFPPPTSRRSHAGVLAASALACLVVVVGVLVLTATLAPHGASGASLPSLRQQLGAQQVRERTLRASVGRLSGLTATLQGQVAFVREREAAVQAQLRSERMQLAATARALVRERAWLTVLRRRLMAAQALLARQLVSGYENPPPGLVQAVLEAHGFNQLLEQLSFLGDAEGEQQRLISITRSARGRALRAAATLARLDLIQRQAAFAATQRVRALVGMNALLSAREAALARAQALQRTALVAASARGRTLQGDIVRLQAEQTPAAPATPTANGPALGPSGGWAIPYPIVLCESGGQNLTPNSAGASGYYQILASTWRLYGGSGPAAYLASKAEQDAVASRIWDGGRGASAWVCAQMLGYVH